MRCASVRFPFDPSILRPSGVVRPLSSQKWTKPSWTTTVSLSGDLGIDEISSTLPHLDLMMVTKMNKPNLFTTYIDLNNLKYQKTSHPGSWNFTSSVGGVSAARIGIIPRGVPPTSTTEG